MPPRTFNQGGVKSGCHPISTIRPGKVSRLTGEPLRNIAVRTTLLGGGFGRRSITEDVDDAVLLSKRLGRPVQVIWSREDDIRHGRFREMAAHRMTLKADSDGHIATGLTGW